MRKNALAKRLSLPGDWRERAAAGIARHFFSRISFQPGYIIAGYWPVKGEADVRPLLRTAVQQGGVAALPCVEKKAGPLVFRQWSENAVMREGNYGIMEPEAFSPPVVPDLVLVPMLAFDDAGGRLGYGAGYYDRTLQKLRLEKASLIAAGIAFEAQHVLHVPHGPHDGRMDMIITEKTIREFREKTP